MSLGGSSYEFGVHPKLSFGLLVSLKFCKFDKSTDSIFCNSCITERGVFVLFHALNLFQLSFVPRV